MLDYSFSLNTLEYFILILVRISMFVYIAPFYGMTNVPRRVKVALAIFVSMLLYSVFPETQVEYSGIFTYSVIVVKEGITGLLIGFAANICNSIILLAGNMIDMHLGFSMAQEYDPVTKAQSSVSASLYQYFLLMLLVATNMHHYILRAVIDSFKLIPIGGVLFQWDYLLLGMIQFVTDLFIIAFRITLPVFACIMILNSVLGIMAKVSPQLNMFAVGMQLKVLSGLVVLLLTVRLLPMVADYMFTEMKTLMVYMIKGMYISG